MLCDGLIVTDKQPDGSLPRWLRWTARGGGTWWWTAIVIVVPVVLITAVALTVLLLTVDVASNTTARIELIKTALTIGAGTGGVVALVLTGRRQWSNERTARATEFDSTERRITELFTKAVEQLGHVAPAVQIGGLYALERIGRHHPAERDSIVDVICGYLRMSYIPLEDQRDVESLDSKRARNALERVQVTAISIIHRHHRFPIGADRWDTAPLDLDRADLSDAIMPAIDFRDANLIEANLANANLNLAFLPGALLVNANLSGTFLGEAYLEAVDLTNANLSNATLTNAKLTNAKLTNVDLTGADLTGADLTGADLTGADLTGAIGVAVTDGRY